MELLPAVEQAMSDEHTRATQHRVKLFIFDKRKSPSYKSCFLCFFNRLLSFAL